MFLRRHERTIGNKRHTYFALVESYRAESGPRQRTVAHLGELSASDERRWRRTAVFHGAQHDTAQLALFDDATGDSPTAGNVVRIRLDGVGWTNARAFGDVWLGAQLWRLVGLDEIVARHVAHGRETVAPATMVAIEV